MKVTEASPILGRLGSQLPLRTLSYPPPPPLSPFAASSLQPNDVPGGYLFRLLEAFALHVF